MKKKIIGLVILAAGIAWSIPQEKDVEAGSKKIFKLIGKQDIGNGTDLYEVVHKKTGCHYLVTDYTNENIVQMWSPGGNGGVGKPYCD